MSREIPWHAAPHVKHKPILTDGEEPVNNLIPPHDKPLRYDRCHLPEAPFICYIQPMHLWEPGEPTDFPLGKTPTAKKSRQVLPSQEKRLFLE